jgi:hypothetical protein
MHKISVNGQNIELGYNQIADKLVPRIPSTVKHDDCGIGKGMYLHENHAIVLVRIDKTSFMLDATGSSEFDMQIVG